MTIGTDQPVVVRTPTVDILERRAWNDAQLIVLIGPGGTGKTTLSRILASMMGRTSIDLDREFHERIGQIDRYIQSPGYLAYKKANSRLAQNLVESLSGPTILSTSSGFLSLDNPAEVLAKNKNLIARAYSISLLPHADMKLASEIIVERQMMRGIDKDAARQRRIIEERFDLYKSAGDMLAISMAAPSEIAAAIAIRLAPDGIVSAVQDGVVSPRLKMA